MAEIIENTTQVTEPTAEPTTEPTTEPVTESTAEPTAEPTEAPELAVDYDTMYAAVYDATVNAALDLEATDGQTVNSSALSYFEGILINQRVPKDYVIWVGEPYTYTSGYGDRTAYEYCMVTGDLQSTGNYITGTGDLYTLRLNGDVGVTVQEAQAVTLSAPRYYSRSNLDTYSGVVERDWTGILTLICLVLGGLVWFVGKLLRVKY